MAGKVKSNAATGEARIADYRYDDSKRKHIPPAGLAAQGKVADSNRIDYAYNPHLPPTLRSDQTGEADKLPELLEIARTRPLTADEARTLAAALRNQAPWLEWSGKREQQGFAVEPVALHIHERISAQAITKIAARQDAQRDLFADPQLDYRKAVQFYQHDVDPTCGSGTTAYVAEQWGRRWITIDTSRVALSLARQRLMTASFPMYRVQTPCDNGADAGLGACHAPLQKSTHGVSETNPATGFIYKTVPHITLKSIAQNAALDPIFARHQAILEEKLAALNVALSGVTPALHIRLAEKLRDKEKREGKKSVTDADRRRWLLPKDQWREWEAPFDTDELWPTELALALNAYRAAWRDKMAEVNACIEAAAEPESLVDQPEPVKGIVRVSGPFTMEAVMPVAESLGCVSPIGGEPEEMATFGDRDELSVPRAAGDPVNAEAYLDRMLRLLRSDGVRFSNNKSMKFTRLEQFHSDYLEGMKC